MKNPNRVIDKSYLSLENAEERGLIHRDYIAHCFRWSHVVKFLNRSHRYKDAIILDVGCGKEMPLARTLYVNKMSPLKYIGVDANDFNIAEMLVGKKIPVSIWAQTDVCALDPDDVKFEDRLPNVVTCFEVLEHVTPEHCRRMLKQFKNLGSADANFFVSTPCWNGSAAGNHINEMTFDALGALIEDLGFKIQGVFGTFASISDYKHLLAKFQAGDTSVDLRPIFELLSEYYDTNVLSVIFAPLFPENSRNCLWHLTVRKGEESQHRLFNKLDLVHEPWSQHPLWKDLAG